VKGDNQHWLLIALFGWTAILVISVADIGFQTVLAGASLSEALRRGVWLGFLWTLPGVLLSALSFLVFSRWVARRPSLRARVSGYVLLGIAFWLCWAFMHAVALHSGIAGNLEMGPGSATFASMLAQSMAANAFNLLLLFAAMAGIHEAMMSLAEARRHLRRRSDLQGQLAKARSAALSARLNPHFLFNTLHVASGLMGRDVQGSRRVLDDLRELLCEALIRDGRQTVRLEEEIRLVERYLRIQRARFGDRLQVRFDVAPDARSARVPPLLLQPLVENAIQHGVAHQTDGAIVRVRAERRLRRVALSVENTAGAEATPDRPIRERVGLGGVRARLALIFGESATADFRRLESGGFRATVTFPDVSWPRPGAGPQGGGLAAREQSTAEAGQVTPDGIATADAR